MEKVPKKQDKIVIFLLGYALYKGVDFVVQLKVDDNEIS